MSTHNKTPDDEMKYELKPITEERAQELRSKLGQRLKEIEEWIRNRMGRAFDSPKEF